VRVDEPPEEGRALQVTVEARADGDPVPDVPILARTTGAFEAQARALTDAGGQAQLTLDGPDDAEGPVEVEVLARDTDTTARQVATASTQATPTPTPWGWIATALVAIGLAGTAAYRHHRSSPTRPSAPTEGPQLSVRLDPQKQGLGPVWHPDEPTAMTIEVRDADGDPIPHARVNVDGPAGQRTVKVDRQGRAQLDLPAHERGRHPYRVRYEPNTSEPVEAVLEVRIVDYRREIDRRYRRLHEACVRLGLIEPDATPRELGQELGEPADELVRLFERFDYAPHPVDREDYERFMQLYREADPRDAGA
jgi:hypothetical protein